MYYIGIFICFILLNRYLKLEDSDGNDVEENLRIFIVILFSAFWIISIPYLIFVKYKKGRE